MPKIHTAPDSQHKAEELREKGKKKAKTRSKTSYSLTELKRLLEAVLFAADRPVAVETLCQVLSNSPEEDVRKALSEMTREYENTGRSFVLRELAGGFLFLTHPAFESWVRKLYRGRLTMRLSRSALETVAIIAYRQPVSKQTMENIRGVNVDGVLHTLLERKLIRITGREDKVGRPLLYGTTRELLMYLGLNDLNELPEMEEMKAILESQELPPTQVAGTGPFAEVPTESGEPVTVEGTQTESPLSDKPPSEPPQMTAEDDSEDEDEDDDDEEEKDKKD